MAEIIVVNTSLNEDLSRFSHYLWQQKVPHRIVEHDDRQLLLVGSDNDARQVSQAYQRYQQGEAELPQIERVANVEAGSARLSLLASPVSLVFIALSILGYALVVFNAQLGWAGYLTFLEITTGPQGQVLSLPRTEYWRLITPIFLHFGLLHIVFNTLWFWDLGRRIEQLHGSVRMLAAVLLMGLGSNIAQFMAGGDGVFGGMSGVIYGLLGYGWMWSYLCPTRSVHIPKPVLMFMLGWLVFCLLGFTTMLGMGNIANAAHVGGLLIGILLGLGAGFIERLSRKA